MLGVMWDEFERYFRGGRDRIWKILCDLWDKRVKVVKVDWEV